MKSRFISSLIAIVFCPYGVNAKDSMADLPPAQLKHGQWQVERQITKIGEANAEPSVRRSSYCASPQKELGKLFNMASLLCRTEVKKIDDATFDIVAACKLPIGIKGVNHSRLHILSDTEYTLETHTKGNKFGDEVERKEFIKAERLSDCP
ncbi:MAG: hypothetical protein RLZZ502_1673 [Pseudomonadota bacterium]|jgi:hypothetical protein